jgi:predicted RNA-binding protein YlxR (DUF448 family)
VAPKSDLIRLVAARQPSGPALAVRDTAGTMPGRGAYLCRNQRSGAPDGACLSRALSRGGIARALRCPVNVAPEGLESVSR